MQNLHRLTKVFSLTLIIALLPATNALADAKADVLAANDQFYSALNVMFTGDVAPMLAVWSHTDDINYMGPDGGIEVGWKAVKPNWEKQAALKLGGKVHNEDVHLQMGHHLAVIINYEVGENVDGDGKPVSVKIRATNVYRKEDGAWKMIGHHTDLLPWLMAEQ